MSVNCSIGNDIDRALRLLPLCRMYGMYKTDILTRYLVPVSLLFIYLMRTTIRTLYKEMGRVIYLEIAQIFELEKACFTLKSMF